jgi:hypothetical protein
MALSSLAFVLRAPILAKKNRPVRFQEIQQKQCASVTDQGIAEPC